ncbi:MAG: GHKL domain-containing protein, partial [Chitinivibrionales bacterium]|nr:GHKL domain-containing protein [Chitinivibrionales bacterium]
IHDNLKCEADTGLLKIVLGNLIRNAWKYTSKTENPRIEIGIEHSSGCPEFFVRDNGVGFSMADAERIFAPFIRVHSGKEYKGTGIGLSMVQRIIRRHGGDIRAEAQIEKGACFYFTLK